MTQPFIIQMFWAPFYNAQKSRSEEGLGSQEDSIKHYCCVRVGCSPEINIFTTTLGANKKKMFVISKAYNAQ